MRSMMKLRSLLLFFAPAVVCLSLLAGFTTAWFTSESKNTENTIEAGSLSMQLLKYDSASDRYKNIGKNKLFDDGKWEPGTTKIAYLGVTNTGTLSYKYEVKLKTEEGAISLSDVLEYAIITPMSRKNGAALNSWSAITNCSGVKTDKMPKGNVSISEGRTLGSGGADYFMVAVHMKDDADIKYQGAWMEFDLEILAKQVPNESDFFGNRYDANADYINRDTSSAYWLNLIKDGPLGFEEGLESHTKALAGSVSAASDSSRADSKKVLRLEPGARAQFSQKSNTVELSAGIYKLAGYVKLGNVDPSKVSITIWAYKNSVSGSNIVTPLMSDSIVVEADKNGWAYFEMFFDHGQAYSLLQFNINNSDTENAVCFDDLQYLKYVGTEPMSLPGRNDSLQPEDPNAPWKPLAMLDFEGSKFPMVPVSDKYVCGDFGVPGYASSFQCMRLEGKEQAKFSQSQSLDVGHYRLTGYVNLGRTDPSKININVWAYTGTKEGNLRSTTLKDCIVSQRDEDGWCRFEIDFQHKAKYTLMQFIIANYSGDTVYFDNIYYNKYTGSGVPTQTPVVELTDLPGEPAVGDWNNMAVLDFETEVTIIQKQGTHEVIADATRENSAKVLRVDKNSRAQYSQSATLPKGYYRLSGYVKLGDADPSKVSVSIWAYKNSTGTNPVTPTMADCIVGEPDANGWSYFEVDFDHGANYALIQFILNNYDTGNSVLFDDVVYAQYTGEDAPPSTKPDDTEPDDTPPAVGDWNNMAVLDFEKEVTLTQKQGTHEVIADATRENSTKALRVDANSRAQYSQSATLPKGYYRLSGYVKLGDADPAKVSVNIWAYKNSTGTNPVTKTMADCVVGKPDANGWSYFEVDFDHGENYSLIQFILNNYDTGNSVLFDDVVYAQYTGEGVPPATEPDDTEPEVDAWNEMAELDFETEVTLTQKQGTYEVIADATRENSTKALRVDKNSRVQYSESATLPKGYYRLSGYVKLGDADPAKVSVSIWAYKNATGTNPVVKTMADCIVGEPDANGWSYFEVDFDHGADYALIQFIFNNYDTGNSVLFDDVVYAQYTGEGVPPATEPDDTEPDDTEPEVDVWNEMAELDFETEVTLTQKQGTHEVIADATRENSTKVLRVDKNSRAQYSQSATLPKGYYRLSGYVKLGDADPAKVSVSIWAYKNSTGTNPVTPTMADCVVGEPDANGWSYFEVDFDHGANYALIQFIFNNYDTGNSVLFDDVVYAQYTGEGVPPATKPEDTEPDDTEPEVDVWNEMAELDFETEVTLTQKQGTHEVIADATRENSTKALRVDKNSRVQYSVSATLPKGYYRLSGYVKLGDADPAKVSVSIWAYKNSANGGNTVTPTMADCIVGKPSTNGWSYFEVDFNHGANYALIQFIFNNYDTGNSVLFDNVVYAQYTGEGTPEPTDLVTKLAALDFETDVTLTAHQGTHEVIADATRENSTKALLVDANSRVKYAETATLPKGDYRLSGYVKLGDADPAKVSVTIWAYKSSTGANTVTLTMADAIVGEADENGWSYFEMDFDLGADYTLIQFIMNNYNTGNTVLFDDVVYGQYIVVNDPLVTEETELVMMRASYQAGLPVQKQRLDCSPLEEDE